MLTHRAVCVGIGAVLMAFVGAAEEGVSHAPLELVPRLDPGDRVLEFDLPGVEIGIAEYDEGPTGTTVFYFPGEAQVAVDVRGGATGTINTELLRPGHGDGHIEAIVLSGGSAYGLEAATGVASGLLASGRTGTRIDGGIAEVAGAIVYDFGARFSEIYPDVALGRAALANARPGHFPLGSRGAGRSVWQGGFFQEWIPSGQGGAFRQVGATRIAVFTVVNAWGVIVDRDGKVARCRHRDIDTVAEHFAALEKVAFQDQPAGRVRPATGGAGLTANTTLTVVVVNRRLDHRGLRRLAIEVQASMARAIQPYNTGEDGDVVFVATTAAVDDPELPLDRLAIYVGETAWDAVLASIPEDLPPLPTPRRERVDIGAEALARYAGVYDYSPEISVTLRAAPEGILLGRLTAGADVLELFPTDGWVELYPDGEGRFFFDNFWDDTLAFEIARDGRVLGFALNPGSRELRAVRQGAGAAASEPAPRDR